MTLHKEKPYKGFMRNSKRDSSKRRKNRKKVSHLEKFIKTVYGPLFQDVPLGEQRDLPIIKDDGKRKLFIKWYRIWRTKPYKRFVSRIPFFASLIYGISSDITILSLKTHINWYEELVYAKGAIYAVKLLKRVRDACIRFAADQTFERIDELALHEDGLPLKVGHLMPLLKSKNVNYRRCAIQILDIIKLCEVEGDAPSTDSITNPIRGQAEIKGNFIGESFRKLGLIASIEDRTLNKIISNFRSELERMFPQRELSSRIEALKSLSDIHMSVRKGPNGPALGTIIEDFYGVSKSGLLEPITKIAELTENNQLLTILDELSIETKGELSGLEAEVTCIDSRLAIKYEPWCKTRFFAICDWFSQSTLKGLHKWIFNWLSKQVEDGTMSQDSVAEIVRNWTEMKPLLLKDCSGVYSLDLSKATDRIPASLQREIIQQIFGKEIADNWFTICTRRQFHTPQGPTVSFSVGQPLGVYSSWAMLALTHHVVCRLALRLAGKRRNGKSPSYVVIGDDVAMLGSQTAEQYSLLMNTILQVDISPIKGFTPKTSLGRNPLKQQERSISAEIAKRIFIDGEEISVVSPETLKSSWEYPADFPNLLRQLTTRGCIPDTITPVAPISLACLGFSPDIACTFATFPLRPAVTSTVLDALRNSSTVLSFIPWFQTDIIINNDELESMFRWSIRSTLQSTLNKFEKDFNIYIEFARKPIKCGERVYHSKVKEYIVRTLLNRAMLYILDLVVETNLLNFQGPGQKLDEIASALNTMLDFELALKGKPSGKRENLHRMRSRVITKLQPLVLKTVRKAREYFGILLIDAGEQIDFVPEEYININNHCRETRELLSSDLNKLRDEKELNRFMEIVKRRTMEVVT